MLFSPVFNRVMMVVVMRVMMSAGSVIFPFFFSCSDDYIYQLKCKSHKAD
jgi:hypothetical protein